MLGKIKMSLAETIKANDQACRTHKMLSKDFQAFRRDQNFLAVAIK